MQNWSCLWSVRVVRSNDTHRWKLLRRVSTYTHVATFLRMKEKIRRKERYNDNDDGNNYSKGQDYENFEEEYDSTDDKFAALSDGEEASALGKTPNVSTAEEATSGRESNQLAAGLLRSAISVVAHKTEKQKKIDAQEQEARRLEAEVERLREEALDQAYARQRHRNVHTHCFGAGGMGLVKRSGWGFRGSFSTTEIFLDSIYEKRQRPRS